MQLKMHDVNPPC